MAMQLYSHILSRGLRYISCYEEGQIPSRTLMSLSMFHQVPINQRYGYPFTNNVSMATKHLSPHLGIIVVSGLRVIYTIITVRISYDNFITYYVVFSRWVNPVSILLLIFIPMYRLNISYLWPMRWGHQSTYIIVLALYYYPNSY